tara:strand:- start:17 stop:478 length:462 start_codon:yes stop_codon:yes gene_type:complete
MVGTARRMLSEEELNDRYVREMVIETELVEKVPGVDKSMMGNQPAFQYTGESYFEYRSTSKIPNSNKYLGVPLSPPPSLNTEQIFEMLKAVYPEGNPKYRPNYSQDSAMQGNDQIIFDGYQFLTPRDASMINRGLFTTLSFHNKMINLFRVPR